MMNTMCCLHVLLMSITGTDTSSLFGLITCLLTCLNGCLTERMINCLLVLRKIIKIIEMDKHYYLFIQTVTY